jgi:glycosyltransferase involved in cell wall biosynthesis
MRSGAWCVLSKVYLRIVNRTEVVIVGPAHPLRGGIAQFNEVFCQRLLQAGVSAAVVSYYRQYPQLLFPGKTQYTDGPPPADVRVYPWLSSTSPISWRRAAHRIAAMAPEVVVLRYWLPFMAPALGTVAGILRRWGIKVIALVDNVLPHEPRPLDKVLTRWFLRRCSAFVVLSQNVASQLALLAPGKPVHVHAHPIYEHFGEPLPMADARRSLGLPEAGPVVLFFGFVRAYKGLDLLIDAVSICRKAHHLPMHLVVAGEFYGDERPYREQIARLGLSDAITLHNRYIPENAVRLYFSAANLVAQTYRSATQSGVTQIAYHFGTPMLVTDVGALPEMVEHDVAGLVCTPHPDAIAAQLVRYFNRGLEATLRRGVEQARGRYSWEHFTETFLTFVRQLP